MIKLEFSIRDARRAHEIIENYFYNGLCEWIYTNVLEIADADLGEELFADMLDLGIEVEILND